MKSIFLGMFICFLKLNLTSGSFRITILPDFLGYLFILRGIKSLEKESTHLVKIKPYVIGMIICMFIYFIGECLMFTNELNAVISTVLSIGRSIMELYITYRIIQGISDIEEQHQFDLEVEKLFSIWKIRVGLMVVVYIMSLLSGGGGIALIVWFIVEFYFLIVFYRTHSLYNKMLEG